MRDEINKIWSELCKWRERLENVTRTEHREVCIAKVDELQRKYNALIEANFN